MQLLTKILQNNILTSLSKTFLTNLFLWFFRLVMQPTMIHMYAQIQTFYALFTWDANKTKALLSWDSNFLPLFIFSEEDWDENYPDHKLFHWQSVELKMENTLEWSIMAKDFVIQEISSHKIFTMSTSQILKMLRCKMCMWYQELYTKSFLSNVQKNIWLISVTNCCY